MYSQIIINRGIAHEVRYTLDTLDSKQCSEIVSIDQTPVEDLEIDMLKELQEKLDEKLNNGVPSATDLYLDQEYYGDDKWYDEQRNA